MPNERSITYPQKDVITKDEALFYIENWKLLIGNIYDKDHNKNMPHGFFVPFTDIMELYKLRTEVTHITTPEGNEERIYIVGIRAYYCIKERLELPLPITSAVLPVAAILVAVYQTNYREPGEGEYDYNHHYPTYDLIIPVPSVKDQQQAGDAGDYSIYDVTRPCPNLCDLQSILH
ncbi:MAG: hypothetical protein QM687_10365 [Ferruginibacter sp.]